MARAYITYNPADIGLLCQSVTPLERFRHLPVLVADVDDEVVGRLESMQRFYIHTSEFDAYLAILRSIDRLGNESVPTVINISLSPGPGQFNKFEALNRASYIMARKGHVLVFAAGNDGPSPGTISPWSIALWVIGVGSASADGIAPLESSSAGELGNVSGQPTIVAPGRTIVPLREADPLAKEKRHGTMVGLVLIGKDIPGQNRPGLTDVEFVGTSVSAPKVTRLCNFTLIFIRLFYCLDVMLKKRLAGSTANPNAIADINQAILQQEQITENGIEFLSGFEPRRLACLLDFYFQLAAQGAYPAALPYPGDDNTPFPTSVIKDCLKSMAVPMPAYGPHQVGYGFVDERIWTAFFLKFSSADLVRLLYHGDAARLLAAWPNSELPLISNELLGQIKARGDGAQLTSFKAL
jgi:hypothetical protein